MENQKGIDVINKQKKQINEDKYIPKKFLLKVTIGECKNLSLFSHDTINPYVEIEVAGQKYRTQTVLSDKSPKFDKIIDIDLIKTKQEFESLKILFRVWHKTEIYQLYDVEIGNFTVDVASIFKKTTKMTINDWGPLDHKENPNPGYVIFSIVVIEENSKLMGLSSSGFDANELDNEMDLEEDPSKKKKLSNFDEGIPIDLKKYQLSIFIFKGEFGDIKGYTDKTLFKFKIIINQGNPQESLLVSGLSPLWNSEVKFALKMPCYLENINIEIYSDNYFLSRFVMDFHKIQQDGMLDAKWYNLYGPTRENDIFRKLKYQFQYGTDLEEYFYFGRVLAAAKLVVDENPKNIIKTFTDLPLERKKLYNFWLDIYEMTIYDNQYNDSELVLEYQIDTKIICSANAIYSSKIKKFRWKNDDRRFKRVSLELPEDLNQLPFVYLRIKKISNGIFSSTSYIGYLKFDLKSIMNSKEVKPSWNKVRKCETKIDNLEDIGNYLGDILCAFNCFFLKDQNKEILRPVLYDTKNYKKYKLISIIYMGKNFPLKDESNPVFCEVQFYNDPNHPVITDTEIKNANPEWNNILYISALLNEGLELAENIKLFAKFERKFLSNELIGSTEIPVTSIERYNDQEHIEKDIFRKAKWYTLEHPSISTKCFVLARFFLVKTLMNDSQEIKALNNKKLIPEDKNYILFIFIIGVRNIMINIDGGTVRVSYNKSILENLKKSKVQTILFSNNNQDESLQNYNILNNIKNNKNYYEIKIAEESKFIKPVFIEIIDKNKKTVYDSFIDVENHMKYQSNESVETKEKTEVKFNDSKPEIPQKESKIRIHNPLPTNNEESNLRIGETFELYVELEQNKNDLNVNDNEEDYYIRPEINGEYENELRQEDCKFRTTKLRESNKYNLLEESELNFILDVVSSDEGIDAIEQKKIEFENKIEEFVSFKKEKESFICRIYLLNVSNITYKDSENLDNAFYWIKRYNKDFSYRQDKKLFNISEGEINEVVILPIEWPDTMFITIEIHVKRKMGGTHLIGFTIINLEKRFFNKSYAEKLNGIRNFKQIPIESRSLCGQKGDNLSKGALRMWIEILKKSQEASFPQEELVVNVKEKYELRMVVWRIKGIPLVNNNKVNIFIVLRVHEDGKDIDYESDVHYNSTDGRGIFNWRFVHDYTYPKKNTSMKIMIHHKNLIGSELICEKNLKMEKLFQKIHKTKSTIINEREWIKLNNAKNDSNEQGELEMELKILTIQEAESNKVGQGREEPNKDPFLETPLQGRNVFSALGNLLVGFSNFYDGIFRLFKMIGVLTFILILAYFISEIYSVIK